MRTVNPRQPDGTIFWGEIAPSEHLVQFYDHDGVFLDTLAGFVRGGILAGEAVIVIATPAHREALERRLMQQGVDPGLPHFGDRYIALDAEETLSRFMVKEWPDERRFSELVTELLSRAGAGGRRVRAFGEMVAILWGQGYHAATVRLEYLWHELCQRNGFSLFCAYPRAGFTQTTHDSLRQICAAHSRLVANDFYLPRSVMTFPREQRATGDPGSANN